jgi:cell wall-associated NlpC family hydrolase
MQKPLMKLIFVLVVPCALGISSCIFVVGNKEEKGDMASQDTSHAYAPVPDSVQRADTIKRDTVIRTSVSSGQIDTKNVHPNEVVEFAKTLIGIPYKYGSTDPKAGFDCSGFITYVFTHFNVIVPRSSIDFTDVGKDIPMEHAVPGDLILFTGTDSSEKFVGHMGMIVSNENGNVSFIHSTSGKQYGVTITPMSDYYRSRYMKTIRIFPENG